MIAGRRDVDPGPRVPAMKKKIGTKGAEAMLALYKAVVTDVKHMHID